MSINLIIEVLFLSLVYHKDEVAKVFYLQFLLYL